MEKRKIALFGGTFDPIHRGHITVVEHAVKIIGAEKIILVPAKHSPLKSFLPHASDDDRLQMMALAIKGNNKFECSDYELKKSMPSYTLETVRKFQADLGADTTIYWLIGADTVNDLPLWYNVTSLIDECNLSVMYRAGYDKPDFTKYMNLWGSERVNKLTENMIETPLVNISSTEIRRRLSKGLDVTDMLAPAVAEYIKQHKLYI